MKTAMTISVEKDLSNKFKKSCIALGIPHSKVISDLMELHLSGNLCHTEKVSKKLEDMIEMFEEVKAFMPSVNPAVQDKPVDKGDEF